MYIRTTAFSLLSLFTTAQRAAEIEGDLIEQSRYYGSFWFKIHVLGTTFALFKASFRQAPVQITVLAVTATGLSWLACDVFSWMFFAPDAVLTVPVLGILATFSWAFLTGFALEYLSPGLGVRAAGLTTFLLLLLGLVTQTLAGWALISGDLEAGIGAALLNVFVSIVLTLAGFALSLVIFLAPLMMGSVYAYNRSGIDDGQEPDV